MRKTNRKRLQIVASSVLLLGLTINIFWTAKWEEENLVDVYTDRYEESTLESRCYLEQLNRIDNNKQVKVWYCENKDNLEKFRLNETANLLSRLNLEWCRIVQSEDEHIKKNRWSVYATDVACIRWKSFDAYSINWGTISYIWEDSRLWTFVILKQGNVEWVYWHTQTSLKVGTEINKWDVIGQTNVTGISQNYHLHFETWIDGMNVKTEDWSIVNDKSLKLKMQRNLLTKEDTDKQDVPWNVKPNDNAEILRFIANFEWKHLQSYWDFTHYSIGYGTPSFKWEEIDDEEADRRAIERIQKIKNYYNLNSLSLNRQKALVSFIYNIWSLNKEQQWLLKNDYIKALANNMKQYQFSKWKKLGWLTKRRNAEYNILTN